MARPLSFADPKAVYVSSRTAVRCTERAACRPTRSALCARFDTGQGVRCEADASGGLRRFDAQVTGLGLIRPQLLASAGMREERKVMIERSIDQATVSNWYDRSRRIAAWAWLYHAGLVTMSALLKPGGGDVRSRLVYSSLAARDILTAF